MKFPKDCWNEDCGHKYIYDLSVDDLVIGCKVLGLECDACDMDWSTPTECPEEM